MPNTIRVLVPVGTVASASAGGPAVPSRVERSEFVIGMLDNHKHNSDKLLDHLQQRLAGHFSDVRFVRIRKPEAGKRAPEKVINDLAACVAVVNGIAD